MERRVGIQFHSLQIGPNLAVSQEATVMMGTDDGVAENTDLLVAITELILQ